MGLVVRRCFDSGVLIFLKMNDVDIDGGRLTRRNADVGLHSGQSLRLPMSTKIPVAREVAEDRGHVRIFAKPIHI